VSSGVAEVCWRITHCKFKDSIDRVQRCFYGAVGFVPCELTTSKHLNCPAAEVYIDEHCDEILSESVDVIQIRERASEAIRGGPLYRLQSGCRSRFQEIDAVRCAFGFSLHKYLAESERYANETLPARFMDYFHAVESQALSAS
jgi:hypothetical protein